MEKRSLGLKMLRSPSRHGEQSLCENCGCLRYNPCHCPKSTKKEKKEEKKEDA